MTSDNQTKNTLRVEGIDTDYCDRFHNVHACWLFGPK